MQISFKGKRALVTGASRGIGRKIALELAQAGAEVIALGRSQELLDSLCAEQKGIHPLVCDLADWERTREAVRGVLPIQLLVNNAGILIPNSILEVTQEDIDKTFAVNVKAAFNVSQVVTDDLIKRGEGGSVVNISSDCAQFGFTALSSYCASKGALDALTRSMALELGPNGIRTNGIAPQLVDTDMARKFCGPNLEKGQPILDRVPLGRATTTDEIAGPALFLLSDHASMINGSTMDVTGGLLTSGP